MRFFALTLPRLFLPLLISSLTPGCGGGGAEAEASSPLGSLDASGADTARIGTVFTPTDVAVVVRSTEVELKWDREDGSSVRLFLGEGNVVLSVRLMIWVGVDTIANYILDCEAEPSRCEPLLLSLFPDRSVAFDGLTIPAAPQESWALDIASAPVVLSGTLKLGFHLSLPEQR